MSNDLYQDLKVLRDFAKHRGSAVILYVLLHTGEAHKEELRRFIGSQKATEQAVQWMMQKKLIVLRSITRSDDARIMGFYRLTPDGQKIAETMNKALVYLVEALRETDGHIRRK